MKKTLNTNQIIIEPDRITLKTIPIRSTGSIVLLVLIALGILVPVLVTILAILDGDQIKSGIIVSYAIFWGTSTYLFRLYSWNSSGQETIVRTKDHYSIVSKSDHFQFSQEAISIENTYFSAIPTRQHDIDGKEIQMARMIVRNVEKQIDLRLELPHEELIKVLSILNKKPNN